MSTILPQGYDSYEAFYRDAYGHALREVRPAGQTGAVMMSVEQDAGDWSDAATPDLVVCMTAKCHGAATIDVGGGCFQIPSAPPGDFLVIPPGYATTFLVDAPHSVRFLAVPYAKLLGLAGPDGGLPRDGDFGRSHGGVQRDREVRDLLDRLWAESARGSPHGALWADGAILQLAAALLRLRDGENAQPTKGGLAPWQVRRVERHIAEQLHEDLSLADLAELVDLSPYHFARAFKASTGLPPHRYGMMLRVDRAKELLVGTGLSITEIAYACGFASSQHMATVFRRLVGTTPKEYRRQGRL